jgi:hypothetical protein
MPAREPGTASGTVRRFPTGHTTTPTRNHPLPPAGTITGTAGNRPLGWTGTAGGAYRAPRRNHQAGTP